MEITGSVLGRWAVMQGHRQVVHTHVPLFTKQYKLVPANGGDALKLGR